MSVIWRRLGQWQRPLCGVSRKPYALRRLHASVMCQSSSEALPATQKAHVYEKNAGPIEVREIALPSIEEDDVLVRVLFTGVCHSDLSIWMGLIPGAQKFPLVGGHEGVGVVARVGRGVKHLRVGDKVGLKWMNKSCQFCEFCREANEVNCPDGCFSGYTRDGTFQQFAAVSAAEAIKIPDGVELAEAAPILCAGVTAYRSIKVAGLRPGQILAVNGAGGGLGSLAIQYAKAIGLQVLAIDGGDKEAFCRELGADFFVDPFRAEDMITDVKKATGGGPHAVLNLCNNIKAINQSIHYVRDRGAVVMVALPKGGVIETDLCSLILRCVQIRTSYVGNKQEVYEALDFVARGQVKPKVCVRPFDQLVHTFDEMKAATFTGRVVLDMWK